MKKLGFMVAALLVLNSASYAQSGFFAAIGGGITAPTGVLSDDNLMGLNIHGSTAYLFSTNIGARMDVQYNSFSLDGARFPGAVGGRLSIVSVKADLLAGNFSRVSKVNPYGSVGLGYYMSSRSDMIIDDIRFTFASSNDLGVGIGGGIMYNFSPKTALYGEAQFNNIFTESDNITFIPLRAGIILRP